MKKSTKLNYNGRKKNPHPQSYPGVKIISSWRLAALSTLAGKKGALFSSFISIFRIFIPFRKSRHMPFGKFIPPFTLTGYSDTAGIEPLLPRTQENRHENPNKICCKKWESSKRKTNNLHFTKRMRAGRVEGVQQKRRRDKLSLRMRKRSCPCKGSLPKPNSNKLF